MRIPGLPQREFHSNKPSNKLLYIKCRYLEWFTTPPHVWFLGIVFWCQKSSQYSIVLLSHSDSEYRNKMNGICASMWVYWNINILGILGIFNIPDYYSHILAPHCLGSHIITCLVKTSWNLSEMEKFSPPLVNHIIQRIKPVWLCIHSTGKQQDLSPLYKLVPLLMIKQTSLYLV